MNFANYELLIQEYLSSNLTASAIRLKLGYWIFQNKKRHQTYTLINTEMIDGTQNCGGVVQNVDFKNITPAHLGKMKIIKIAISIKFGDTLTDFESRYHTFLYTVLLNWVLIGFKSRD